MSNSKATLVLVGILMGLVHDLQCYRKSVNLAKLTNATPPPFDWICLAMHVLQGFSAGFGAGTVVDGAGSH